ncbi:uncharacterized protein LOC141648861 [Silene latifolia]|uniref:uncharacterized protein LOC141648861 n=1 Tax=Silene latifolia TaxID=37657 RepID=UPI003D775F7E
MTNPASDEVINPPNNQSYSLVHVENPGVKITTVAFIGSNYDEWSRAFNLAILTKGKQDYIDGTIRKPAAMTSTFKSWRAINALVTAWIFNSLEPEMSRQISLRPEAFQVWTDIKNHFCRGNETRVYQLQADLIAYRQGPTESLMRYYGRITKIWDEIREYDTLPQCSCNPCACDWVTVMDNQRAKKRVRDFLIGLDDRFDNARSQILGTNPLPDLNLVYNRLLQKEGVRSFGSSKIESRPDVVAFAARTHSGPRTNSTNGGGTRDNTVDRSSNNSSNPNSADGPQFFCIACKRPRHSFKFCYRVTGNVPDWWGDRPRDRIYINPNDTDLSNAVFFPDTRGRALLDRSKKSSNAPTTPRVHMASAPSNNTGNVPSTSRSSAPMLDKIDLNAPNQQELEELSNMLQARKKGSTTDRLNSTFSPSTFSWIVDTGVPHHISGCLGHFTNLRNITPLFVGLPNGDLTIATQSGDIHLSSRLIWRDVLYAANLTCNLISVSILLLDTSLII